MRVFDYQSMTVPDTRILQKGRKQHPSPFLLRVVHSILYYSRIRIACKVITSLIARLSSCQSPALPGSSHGSKSAIFYANPRCHRRKLVLTTFFFDSHMFLTVSGRFSLLTSNQRCTRVHSACELSNSLLDWPLFSSQVVLQVSFWWTYSAAVQSRPDFRVTTG